MTKGLGLGFVLLAVIGSLQAQPTVTAVANAAPNSTSTATRRAAN